MSLVYPRLPTDAALVLIGQIKDGESPQWSTNHSAAVPAPTGTPATAQQLAVVREEIETALSPLQAEPEKFGVANWDAVAGRVLSNALDISATDASSNEVWAFLTLVVLPDFAIDRFPSMAEARLLGWQRNTFRRTWSRHQVLGDMNLPDGVNPLGEDEMVNIFERSKMSRDHRLARSLANEILRYEGRNRSQFARDVSRHVRAMTGPLVLDVCPQAVVESLVSEAAATVIQEAAEASDSSVPPPPPPPPSSKQTTTSTPPPPPFPTAKPSTPALTREQHAILFGDSPPDIPESHS